jgi:hypothetical protein
MDIPKSRTCKFCGHTEPNLTRSLPCICCCGVPCGHEMFFSKHVDTCPQTTC